MDVHVDPSRIHLQEDEGQWVTTLGDQRVVAFRQREGHRAAVDRSTIDDGHEILAGTTAHARLAQQAAQAHARTLEGRHERDLSGHLTAPNLADPIQ